MEAELNEIKKNLYKTFKNLLELESSENDSYNNFQAQNFNTNASTISNNTQLKNLNSSQEIGLQNFAQTLTQLNSVEDKLKTLREEFLLGSEDLINKEINVIKAKLEVKRDSIKNYENFINNSKGSVSELNKY